MTSGNAPAILILLCGLASSCAGPFPVAEKQIGAELAIALASRTPIENGNPASSSGSLSCSVTPGFCRIFITLAGYAPTGADSPTTFSGVAGADLKCQSDANYPGSGAFKALLGDAGLRRATVTPGAGDFQIDWVLKPSTAYKRTDSTPIATTNGNGLFVFPLTGSVVAGATNIWTGLVVDWRVSDGVFLGNGNCTGWSGVASGNVGTSNSITSTFLSTGGFGCAAMLPLVCVEQ